MNKGCADARNDSSRGLSRCRKIVLNGFKFLLLTLLLLRSVCAFAQAPEDSRSLFMQAARSNSISTVDMIPWHLKATYTLFDEDGRADAQGSLEEWWRGAHKRTIAYSSPNFSQTDYVTEQGRFRTGVQASSPFPLSELEKQLTDPFLASEHGNNQPMGVETGVVEQSGTKMLCLKPTGIITPEGPQRYASSYSYCLSSGNRELAFVESPDPDPIQFNRLEFISFGGRSIPGDLVVVRGGKKMMIAHVDALEQLKEIDEARLKPDADAKPVGIRVTLSARAMQSMLLEKKELEYPPDAKGAGISGTVSVQVLIGKDGRITDLYPISGPHELQGAALNSVRGWLFKPYLLGGKPVEASATIYTVFSK